MNPKKVVIKFLNGRVLRGEVLRFIPQTVKIKVTTSEGEETIGLPLLKAIFFLRESPAKPSGDKLLKAGGKRVRVCFADGEELIGYTYGLHPLGIGFYLFPIAAADNNEKIFVVKANAVKIQTLLDKEQIL